MLATIVRGAFVHSREAVRTMLRSGAGAIVSLASIASTVAMKDLAAYAASKGAIAQLGGDRC